MDSYNFEWPIRLLANTNAPFTVLTPPALADHLHGIVERFARALEN